MAKYAMSTLGQGANSYIDLPPWTRSSSSASTWMLGLTCRIFDLSVNQHLLGRSGSTAGSLRVLPDGALRYRDSSADLITSAAGLITIDVFFTVVLRKLADPTNVIELWIGPDGMDEQLIGGVKIGETTSVVSQILNPLNQVARFSTTVRSDVEVKKVWMIGGSYTDGWDHTTTSGVSANWMSTSGSRSLTIINAAGAPDSWWQLYDAAQIGEGTASVNATATVALSGAKVGNANVSAVASALAAVQGSKIGTASVSMPITAGIALSGSKSGVGIVSMPVTAVLGVAAHKVGAGHLYIVAAADIALYAGNIYVGNGTFMVSAAAAIALQGEKVGQSQVQFEAAAALYCSASKLGAATATAMASGSAQLQASKTSQATPQVTAAAALAVDGYKVGVGSVAVLASASIDLTGNNPAAVPAPVTMVFVRTSSRYHQQVRTSGRYNYNIKTSSGGARV